jgi:hypothetical protein
MPVILSTPSLHRSDNDIGALQSCVTSTLAQQDLPHEPSILRTIANRHGGCLGVYACVASPGPLRVGHKVTLRSDMTDD